MSQPLSQDPLAWHTFEDFEVKFKGTCVHCKGLQCMQLQIFEAMCKIVEVCGDHKCIVCTNQNDKPIKQSVFVSWIRMHKCVLYPQ